MADFFEVNDSGNVFVGGASAFTRKLNILQDGTAISIGSDPSTTTRAAIWLDETTPSTANYALVGESGSTLLNASSSVLLRIGGNTRATLSSTKFYFESLITGVGFKGVSSPTAQAHFSAGESGASTAPIKLSSGTNMSTPEAGAIEYDGTSLFFTNAGAKRQELIQFQQSRVSAQFDKTSDTSLANITGLTATLVAGKIYRFEATLFTSSDVGGGVKVAIAGTATATSIVYEGLSTDAGLSTQSRSTALAGAVGAITAVTAAFIKISGLITCNAAGTLTVQFAQNTSNGAPSSVLVGSSFVVSQIA